jgi:hypothetical protein
MANQHWFKVTPFGIHCAHELSLHVLYSFMGAVEKQIMLQDMLFCLLATLVTVWQCVPWFVLAKSSSAFCMQIQDGNKHLNSKLKEKTLSYTLVNIVLHSECYG